MHCRSLVLVTTGVGALPCPVSACTQSCHTAYFFCTPHRLESLSPFRAELPSERGTRLRRFVKDPVCAPCRVFVFLTLPWIACVNNARFDDLTSGSVLGRLVRRIDCRPK